MTRKGANNRPGRWRNAIARCVLSAGIVIVVGCSQSGPNPPLTPATQSNVQAWFVEAGEGSGIRFQHQVGDPTDYDMPQIMGSGGALVDHDGDDDLDIILIGDHQFTLLEQRNGAFVDHTVNSHIQADSLGMGVAAGDLNGDGFTDLLLTNYGPDALWLNNGDGTYNEVATAAGLSHAGWGTAACLFDKNRDGLLDLFIVNYVDYVPGQWCEDRAGRREFCGPSSFSGTVDRMYLNSGKQTDQGAPVFTDVTIESGFANNAGKGLGIVAADVTDDNRPDLYVANDMESNHLWVQQTDGTYVDEALWRGAAFNGLGESEASMGTVLADLDGDLREELFLTHLRGESHTLYAPVGSGQFQDVTGRSGLATASLQYTGFGVACADFECDGDLDLAIANGRVKRAPALSGCELGRFWCDYAESNQLLLNDGHGRFTEASSEGGGFASRIEVSRGLAQGDIDNDGDIDLLLTNCGGSARLYFNEATPQGNWLIVKLVDSTTERNGFEARVTVTAGEMTMVRQVSPGMGYLTTSDFRVHFGLGERERYDRLTVEWPDGVIEDFPGGAVNRAVLLCRGGRVLNARPDR